MSGGTDTIRWRVAPKTATEVCGEDAEKKRREFLENVEALVKAVETLFAVQGLDSEHRRKAMADLKKARVPFMGKGEKE